jgi:hypothetical protein
MKIAVGWSSIEEFRSTKSKGSVRSIARASYPSLKRWPGDPLAPEANKGRPALGIAGYHQHPSRLPLFVVPCLSVALR